MIRKILVANRGEIAVRIIRACRELGIQAVAVYSDADRLSQHVFVADEAYPIGAPPSSASYLRGDAIIDVARRSGCDAIHPGYGFLAERAPFAEAVAAAGLTFIGPPAAAIAAMGDKTEARRRMKAAGVPIVPGTEEPLADAAQAGALAAAIGYPVLLKAAAGGGGKGMRIVAEPAELPRSFDAAVSEATGAFGDGSLYLEKYLEGPRHIEVQVLADAHGHVIHLGERECSIQRRHQKLVEECPSPAITPALRRAMGEAAAAAAAAVGYRNAGTVEFLFKDGEFYFLEMNTRLQVEHPVTELVTGLDLVQWQIRIAAGEVLTIAQDDVRLTGHAMECRITSESPESGFLPSTGTISFLHVPAGPGVRWDGGILQGSEVTPYYDPLLGKLIVHAPDRAAAIERLRRALAEFRIVGVDTSIRFHRRLMKEPEFRAGRMDIQYLDRHPELTRPDAPEEVLRTVALTAALLEEEERQRRGIQRLQPAAGGGADGGAWRGRGWRWG
jgi:acetyl-CoA carboxylase, biotin carboxylase subunit